MSERFAIVTGASSGIGYELAKQCAHNGFDLLIAADSAEIHDAARTLDISRIAPLPCPIIRRTAARAV